jgi:hypothetical protein
MRGFPGSELPPWHAKFTVNGATTYIGTGSVFGGKTLVLLLVIETSALFWTSITSAPLAG